MSSSEFSTQGFCSQLLAVRAPMQRSAASPSSRYTLTHSNGVAMSEHSQTISTVEVAAMSSSDPPVEPVPANFDQQPTNNILETTQPQSTSVNVIDEEEDEQPSTIEQSTITLHDHSSPRSLSAVDQQPITSHPTRPSSSTSRPTTAYHLPIDPRFPSNPSPQLLAILAAADEADNLTAQQPPQLSGRGGMGSSERPESAVALGGVDTLQGLPSSQSSMDYALSVMGEKMRWRESTRVERAARVQRRKDELLAEFEAEFKGAANVPTTSIKQHASKHAHNRVVGTLTSNHPVAVS